MLEQFLNKYFNEKKSITASYIVGQNKENSFNEGCLLLIKQITKQKDGLAKVCRKKSTR